MSYLFFDNYQRAVSTITRGQAAQGIAVRELVREANARLERHGVSDWHFEQSPEAVTGLDINLLHKGFASVAVPVEPLVLAALLGEVPE